MVDLSQHSFNEKEICLKCGRTKEQIEDGKITACKNNLIKIITSSNKNVKKKYI